MNSKTRQSTFSRKFFERLSVAVVLFAITGIGETAPVMVYAKFSQVTEPSASSLSPVYDDPDAGGEEE